jgi:hypothetical protein
MAAPGPANGEMGPDLMGSSIFGVGYSALKPPGIAAAWADSGIRSIKQPFIHWQFAEPVKPKNKHKYRWMLLDRIVREYQRHGFCIQMEFTTKSKWASKPLKNKLLDIRGAGTASTAPMPEHEQDFADWVQALVERYDGDGVKDMPGLKFPTLYYEFASEAQHEAIWQGTTEEYCKTLKIAYEAIKRANPNAKMILCGLAFGDLFDDMPSDDEATRRFKSVASAGRRDQEFIDAVLKQTDYYDIVEFHYNRDYLGIYKTVEYIRRFTDKPIWAGDATSAPFLQALKNVSFNPFCPPEKGKALYEKIVAKDPETVAWFRREQARLTTKKFVVAAEMDLKKVMIELTAIWKATKGVGMFHQNFHVQNMLDENLQPLPVFLTLQILVEKIDGYTSVKRLNVGDKEIFAYQFTVKEKPVYVFWYEDRHHQLPGEKEGNRKIEFDIGSDQALVTQIATDMDLKPPHGETRQTAKGKLPLNITETPIFVEPI